MYPKIGIRPVIDGRQFGVRESLEEQTMNMAKAAKTLIESECFYADGTPAQCVITPFTIGGGAEAAKAEEFFAVKNVCATLSVTPCWCYGSETMDFNPLNIKAVWGFNGTERPGAVYLAAVMSAHAQRGLPAFAVYGRDVQDAGDTNIPRDVREKLLRFAQCSLAAGQMRNKAYVGIGGVSMGIAGSYTDADFMQKYLGIRPEWVDMTEVLRRIKLEIYDKDEYEKAYKWTRANCPEGTDFNTGVNEGNKGLMSKDEQWEFCVKMTLIIRDIMLGNPKLAELGWLEEAKGRNAIFGGFQGQRQWTDWLPNCDFTESILSSTFDWNGKKQPVLLATENDSLNGVAMLFGNLLSGRASIFADVRTYWSPEAVERVTGIKPTGKASDGFIHLINSGAAAVDAAGVSTGGIMKRWWEVTDSDIKAMLEATDWCQANLGYFRGGGFSSHFKTQSEMPVTLIRVNLVGGLGPALQIAEGFTVTLPDEIHNPLDVRTDKTWPTTWFVPNLLENNSAFSDVYSVMANWGANHGSFTYGHIGADLITLASMLRIPVSMHNVAEKDRIFRPHSWSAFGTDCAQSADYKACKCYGSLY
ncbi:MAG: L-fucose isomerase [Oscillospiraceae bacterium]|jgi:L-fucose isomerase|nr:L-fucose isomerase [Oscillospiraceae bacterium]